MSIYTLIRTCCIDGCSEFSFYEYKSRARYKKAENRYHGVEYRCPYHQKDGITPQNVCHAEEHKYTVIRKNSHNYFDPDVKTFVSGILFGEGWAARADDFPVGTVIVVNSDVTVVLPPDKDNKS